MTGWQVIRLHQGAVTVCCAHRYELVADVCSAWRNWQPGSRRHGLRYDIRQEPVKENR